MDQHDPDGVLRAERETWNRSAASYMGFAELTSHAVDTLMELANLDPGDRVLEVGCGPGHIARKLADAGAVVTGVDLASEMVAEARYLNPGIEFIEANAESLPFDDDAFEVTLVNFTIHHFARPEIACAEIHRVLKPGGRFVFAGPIEQFGFGAFIEGLTTHHTMEALPHGPIYLGATKADYQRVMREAGFSRIDVDEHQITLCLKSLDPLFQAGWEICGLCGLPEEIQRRIRETTIELAAPYKCEEGYAFPDRVVIGVALK